MFFLIVLSAVIYLAVYFNRTNDEINQVSKSIKERRKRQREHDDYNHYKKNINVILSFLKFIFIYHDLIHTQIDTSGLRKRVEPAGKSRESYWILQENIGKINGKWKQYSDRTFSDFFRRFPRRFPRKIHQKTVISHQNMFTIRQEMAGPHQEISNDFPAISSENS